LLLFAAWLAAVFTIHAPRVDLDSSWSNGVNSAIVTGKQFGTQIDFTYGPWANLDEPTVLSAQSLFYGIVASAIIGIAITLIAWKLVRRWLPALPAAITVTFLAIPTVTLLAGFSVRVLLLSLMCALGLQITAIPERWRTYVIVTLSVLSGLAILTKISNGTLAAGTVLLIAILGPGQAWSRRLIRMAISLGTLAVSVVVFWLAAGQSLGNFAAWAGASISLTSGYAEAMNIENPGALGQYFVLGTLAVVLVIQLLNRTGPGAVGLFLIVLWAVAIAVRVGFTRHDLGHPTQSFVLLVIVCLALGATRSAWLPFLGATVAAATALSAVPVSYGSLIDPSSLMSRSVETTSALVSRQYRERVLDLARTKLVKGYDVSPSVLQAINGGSVHVDPYDANVAWAYRLNWDPVPVFQTYSAYTSSLDSINTEALLQSSGPEFVLRAPLKAIDGRNPMWESPDYMRALVCDFAPSVKTDKWLLLKRGADRCGGDQVSLGQSSFTANERIDIPTAPEGYLVTASFILDQTPANWLATTLFKPLSTVSVSTDHGTYRLPRAHAPGPLIVSMPTTAGWPTKFGGDTSATTLKLNISGSVEFTAVPIRS
jgi:hypothetical protein